MATLRKIGSMSVGTVTAIVYRDSEWQEYRVRLAIDGTKQAESSDYHTDDIDDARRTAWSMARHTAHKLTGYSMPAGA